MRIASLSFMLLSTITIFPAVAQLKVGITGGMVMSSLIRDSQLNAREGKIGYVVGANVKYNIGELGWFIQSGVSYTLEGDHDQPLNFVKLPVILGLDFSDDVNFNVSYNFVWQTGNKNGVKEFYNNYASILGLGAEIYAGKKFVPGFRLNYGLSNLVNVPIDAKNFRVKPFTLDLYLTYYFF